MKEKIMKENNQTVTEPYKNGSLTDNRRSWVRRFEDRKMVDEVQDLSKQIDLMQKELEQLEKLKPLAVIASTVIHDIRNSLGVISSTAQFVQDKLALSDQSRQAWEMVSRNVQIVQKMLKSYLGLARQIENKKESVSLNDIINRIVHFLEMQLKNQNIKVDKNLDPSIPLLWIDIPSVESAVLNLFMNASEAIKNGGTIKFTTKKQGSDRVVLEIADTGSGIPPEVLNKLFTPFFTTKEKGTGIGLCSAKATVESNGGKITCESKVGVGTKMILSFLVKPPETATAH